ncbi:MAG: dihydroorotate dehydrogenase [Mycobacterium leprae]
MAQIGVELLGMRFRNPVIPAAGPNVGNGARLCQAAEGGAGGLLAKTISTKAAAVPRPHMQRYGSTGLLNTELWSELPPEAWLDHEYETGLTAARKHGIPFLASIGYSPAELRQLGPVVEAMGVDALEFSIHYLDPAQLVETAKALRDAVHIPIIAKLSPHKGDLGELAAAIEPYVDGFACINSYGPALHIDLERMEPMLGSALGYGWLSGSPIRPLALRSVYEVARRVKKPVIGVGGATTGSDVIAFFMAGASLVQVCTAILLRGQSHYGRMAREVNDWLDQHGYTDIKEIQGLYLRHAGCAGGGLVG